MHGVKIIVNKYNFNYLQNIPDFWRDLQTKKTSGKLRHDISWWKLRFNTGCFTLLQFPVNQKEQRSSSPEVLQNPL